MTLTQSPDAVINAMTIDVEDYFHVSVFDGRNLKLATLEIFELPFLRNLITATSGYKGPILIQHIVKG